MRLTKTQATLLLPIGETEFAGTQAELLDHIESTYWVLDGAPYPYPVRERQMKVLETLAARLGYTIVLQEQR